MKPLPASCASATPTDSDLLLAFATRRDEAAFRLLTERYAGMVYGIAARRLGDAHAAQEVASEVFTLLARKASSLSRTGSLAAWLQRSAVLVTANAARREIRRRNAMNAYSLSPDPAASHSAEDPAWRAGAEHLDEAMACLPERDRALLMARFFAGLTHREIARGEGVGEESVKKAGQRALNKLRALLLRRGVTLSVAVLASGLPRHVQAAAPEGFAAQVSAAALGAAPTLGLLPALRHSLTYMFYGKTLTTTAAALLLCAVLGGGCSFLTAQQLAARFSHLPENAAAGPGQSAKAAKANNETTPATARGVGDIVREAIYLLRHQSRPEGSPEWHRAILLLAGLSLEETREAARVAEAYREDSSLADLLSVALSAAWAEKAPEEALDWLEVYPRPPKSLPNGRADYIAGLWFLRDGQAAWDWWKRRRVAQPPPVEGWPEFIGTGVALWARTDPAAAATAVGSIDSRPWIVQGFASQLSKQDLGADSPVIDAALRWKNPSLRAQFALALAGGATERPGDPLASVERVFPLLNRLCADDAGVLEEACALLIRPWAAGSPAEAATWVLDAATPSSVNTRILLEPALDVWVKKEPEAASMWVQKRLAGADARNDRIFDALLATENEVRVEGSPWPSPDWARRIEGWAPGQRDGFMRFWGERRLRPVLGDPLAAQQNLAQWRTEIAAAEKTGNTAGAQLAVGALEYAERKAAAFGSAPGTATPISAQP